jgi:hypothetical protein
MVHVVRDDLLEAVHMGIDIDEFERCGEPTLAMSVVLRGVETYFVGYEMFSLPFWVVGKNTRSSS